MLRSEHLTALSLRAFRNARVLAVVFAIATGSAGFAAGNSFTFSYSGRLTEANGRPIVGPVGLAVSFYRTATGGAPVLTVTEGLTDVPLQEGIFQLSLTLSGSDFHNAFPSVTEAVYVEITDLTHRRKDPYARQLVAMVPYAAKVPVDNDTLEFNSQGELTVKSSPASGTTAISSINAATSGTIAEARLPAFGGDLSGSVSAATVAKIQGRPVGAIAPNNDEFLKWNGTAWIPAAITGAAGGTVTSVATGAGLSGGPITASGTIDLKLNAAGGLSKGLGVGSDELGIADAGVSLAKLSNTGTNCATAGKVLRVAGGVWTCADVMENALTNGTTDKAPSEDAVFDALATKQPTITMFTDLTTGSVESASQAGFVAGPYGTAAGETGELRFKELAASGDNFVGFKAPNAIAGGAGVGTIWTLPAADGLGGQVLSTNGSGVLSWASSGVASGSIANADISGTAAIADTKLATIATAGKVSDTALSSNVSLLGSSIGLASSEVSGTLPIGNGGTGAATLTGVTVGNGTSAMTGVAGTASQYLRRNAGDTAYEFASLGSLVSLNAVSGGTAGTITDDSITNADINSNAAIADSKLATIATAGKVADTALSSNVSLLGSNIDLASSEVTGTVALGNGGTGATTQAGAANAVLPTQASNSGKYLTTNGTNVSWSTVAPSVSSLAASDGTPAQAVAVDAAGNVGIGTTSPSDMLHLKGDGIGLIFQSNTDNLADSSDIRLLESAGVGGMRIRYDGTDVGTSNGRLRFQENNTNNDLMTIDRNGYVGIGTTAPTAILHTVASGAKTADYSGTLLTNTATSNTSSIRKSALEVQSTGTWIGVAATNVGLYVGSVTGGWYNYDAIFNGGNNVGINTTAPLFRLDVKEASTAKVASLRRGAQAGGDSSMVTTFGTPYLLVGGHEFRTNSIQTIGFGYSFGNQPAEIGLLTTDTSGFTKGDIVVANRAGTTDVAPTEVMRITSAGNVGIGTTSPGQKLSVAGTVESTTGGFKFPDGTTQTTAATGGGSVSNLTSDVTFTDAANHSMSVNRTTTAATAGHDLSVTAGGGYSTGTNLAGGALVLSSGIATGSGTSQIDFKTAGGGSSGTSDSAPTTKMTILGNGNVGIGTTYPTAPLDIFKSGIGATSTDGLLLENTTAAAAGAQQYSPRLHLAGQGWKTTATAASQSVDWVTQVVPVQGTGAPSSYLDFSASINGGAYSNAIAIRSNGRLGVGTTAPAAPLGVKGASSMTADFYNGVSFFHNGSSATSGATSAYVADFTTDTGSTDSIVRWGPGYVDSGSLGGYLGYYGGTETVSVTALNGDLSFGLNEGAEWMRLNRTGVRVDMYGTARVTASATSVLSGSIDPTASTAVVGVSTEFTTELALGDRILVSGETRTVTAIADDTHLTVDTAFSNNGNDTAPDRYPAALSVLNSASAVKMVVSDQGNVGIGTTSPGQKLSVAGTIESTTGGIKYPDATVQTSAAPGYILIQEQYASGTAPGGFTAGAWQTRNLNTIVQDTGSNVVSVSSGSVTLKAGTYDCDGSAPAYRVNEHITRLYNVQSSTQITLGTSRSAGSGDTTDSTSTLSARFTLAVDSAIRIEHYGMVTKATDGFGAGWNASLPTIGVFAVLQCRRYY